MAHKRKDSLAKCPQWWKHLRPYVKRKVAKAERRAAKKDIGISKNDIDLLKRIVSII